MKTDEQKIQEVEDALDGKLSIKKQVKKYLELGDSIPGSGLLLIRDFPDFGTKDWVEEYLQQSGDINENRSKSQRS